MVAPGASLGLAVIKNVFSPEGDAIRRDHVCPKTLSLCRSLTFLISSFDKRFVPFPLQSQIVVGSNSTSCLSNNDRNSSWNER